MAPATFGKDLALTVAVWEETWKALIAWDVGEHSPKVIDDIDGTSRLLVKSDVDPGKQVAHRELLLKADSAAVSDLGANLGGHAPLLPVQLTLLWYMSKQIRPRGCVALEALTKLTPSRRPATHHRLRFVHPRKP